MLSLVLNDDFLSLINTMQLNLYCGKQSLNLLDLFPLLKKGSCYLNTISTLIRCYACYYGLMDNGYIMPDKETTHEEQCLCLAKFIKQSIPDWSDKQKNNHYVDVIVLQNSTFNAYIHISEELEREKDLSILIAMISYIRECDYCLYPFIKGFNRVRSGVVYKSLKTHPKVSKLCISVVFGEEDKVRKRLETLDARSNNFAAYTLSLEENNATIIQLIREQIILKTLLHQQILIKYFGVTTLVHDLYSLMVEMM